MPTINRILSTEDCFDEIFHGAIREKILFHFGESCAVTKPSSNDESDGTKPD